MTLMPPPNKFSAKGTPPGKLEWLFGFGRPKGAVDEPGTHHLHDAHVRVIIYDEQLYANSKLGRLHEDGLKLEHFRHTIGTTKVRQIILSPEEADPPLGSGSGVLLKLEGRIKQSPNGQKWWFQPEAAGREENTDALGKIAGEFDLHMVSRAQDANKQIRSKVATIRYLRQDVGSSNGRLLMRMVFIGTTFIEGGEHDVLPAEQILSSVTKQNTAFPVVLKVDLDSLTVKRGSQTGGNGGNSAPQATTSTPRLLTPELTGLYEAESVGGRDPVLHVQINQCGHTLAGWFQPPPFFPRDNPPGLHPGIPRKAGVFSVFERTTPMPTKGWAMSWVEMGVDPDTEAPNVQPLAGNLRLLPGVAPDAIDQRIELTFNSPKDGSKSIIIRRMRTNTRWSNEALQHAFTTDHKIWRELVADRVAPIPGMYWDRLNAFVRGSTTRGKKMVALIKKWDENSGGVRRSMGRLVADEIESEIVGARDIRANGFKDAYLKRVQDAFQVFAIDPKNAITVNGKTQVPMQWFEQILGELMDHERKLQEQKKANGEPFLGDDEKIFKQKMPKGFVEIGMPVSGKFIYKFEFFTSLGLSGKALIGGGMFLFHVAIDKFEKLSDGKLKQHGAADGWNPPPPPKHRYHGTMVEVGAGLAISGGTVASGGASAKPPGKVEIKSAFDLTWQEFEYAYFSTVSTSAGPAASAGGFGFTTFKSTLLSLTLTKGLRLSTVVDNVVKWSIPKKWSDFTPSIGASLFNISMGYGHFLLSIGALPPSKPDPKKKVRPPFKARSTQSSRLGVHYARDKATLTTDSRLRLELACAVRRSFFEHDGWIMAFGYASPLGRTTTNEELSGLRARNLLRAIKDAFGTSVALPIDDKHPGGTSWVAMGEESSWSKLLDPPGPEQHEKRTKAAQFSKAELERIKREARDEYWKWRKTELHVNGEFLMEVGDPKPAPKAAPAPTTP